MVRNKPSLLFIRGYEEASRGAWGRASSPVAVDRVEETTHQCSALLATN